MRHRRHRVHFILELLAGSARRGTARIEKLGVILGARTRACELAILKNIFMTAGRVPGARGRAGPRCSAAPSGSSAGARPPRYASAEVDGRVVEGAVAPGTRCGRYQLNSLPEGFPRLERAT